MALETYFGVAETKMLNKAQTELKAKSWPYTASQINSFSALSWSNPAYSVFDPKI